MENEVEIKIREIKMVPIGEIRLNPRNRNKHPKKQIEEIAKLYRYHGMRTPLIVSNQSGLCVAGEGRYLAAKRAGLKEVPVSFQDFDSEEQEYAFGISDNAIGLWSELDLPQINTDIQELGPDIDVAVLGIEGFEVEPADRDKGKYKTCGECGRKIKA